MILSGHNVILKKNIQIVHAHNAHLEDLHEGYKRHKVVSKRRYQCVAVVTQMSIKSFWQVYCTSSKWVRRLARPSSDSGALAVHNCYGLPLKKSRQAIRFSTSL